MRSRRRCSSKNAAGGDTTVTIFSMTPDSLKEGLRRALAMGADDAVVLSDKALEGSDVSATAYAMASGAADAKLRSARRPAALRTTAAPAPSPGHFAEHLGLPCITNARKVDIKGDAIEVERENHSGYQTVRGPLPALLTTALTFGSRGNASLKGIMGAKKKEHRHDIAAGPLPRPPGGHYRLENRAAQFRAAPVRGKGKVIEASDGLSGAQAIFDFLAEKRLV